MRRASVWAVLLVMGMGMNAYAMGPLGGWTASVDLWMAGASNFDENPGPEAAGHVWGDFPTTFYSATVAKDLIAGLQAEVVLGGLSMGKSTMYLHSEDVTTEFDGSGIQFLGRLNYHLLNLAGIKLDLGAGYHSVSAVKKFYNQTVSGSVMQSGNWGEYKIQYGGPVATLKASWNTPLGIGFGGKIDGAPMINNHTEVNDGTTTTVEEANGLRYCIEGYLAYTALPLLSLSAGYRYEDIYFQEPSPDSFDLAIKYAGPFLKATLEF